MRRTALNGPDSADVGGTLRRELRDGEVRGLLRGMSLHERLAAVQADPEVARAVAGASPMLSGLPADVHANLVADLTDRAVAERFGGRAAQVGVDIEEVEAVAAAIELAVGLVAREGFDA